MKSIAIMGASGHCKVVAEIALENGYDNIVFVDLNPTIDMLGEYPVADEDTDLENFINEKYDFIVGIGDAKIRRKVQEKLIAKGANIVTLIHPAAAIAYDVSIGTGTVIMAGAVVNPGTKIGDGCIINTCSMSAKIVNVPQQQIAYNSSKGGVLHMTRTLAVELAPHGIRVNSVSPGYMFTPMTAKRPQELKDFWMARIPQGRMGTPEDLATAYIYLASDFSKYTTGCDIVVDCGYTNL